MRWPIVFLAGCSFTHGAAGTSTLDADTQIDAAMADTADVAGDSLGVGPWTNIHTVFPNAPVGDDDPTLTADLLELYFNRADDIYVTQRTAIDQPWDTPTLVTALSSVSVETTPEITGNGLAIFIASDRAPTDGGEDIWVSKRPTRTAGWPAPTHIPALSSATDDAASAPTDDLLAIVLIGNPTGTDVDLYLSTRATSSASWGTPAPITSANSTTSDFSPMLSQDRTTLYFDSYRGNVNVLDDDLYVATRAGASGAFSTPTAISELNTTGQESDPWVSDDSHHMFFVRDGVLYEASR